MNRNSLAFKARTTLLTCLGVAVAALGITCGQASAATPGTAPSSAPVTAGSLDPLTPFFSASGFISVSEDAIGTNDNSNPNDILKVHKNAGATVQRAFLFAASTGFTGYVPANGDISLDGTPVNWGSTGGNDIGSFNAEADVTALVKPIVDAAPAGDVNFTYSEGPQTFNYDGSILVVVLNDPTVTTASSVAIMYGAQKTTGDSFAIGLAQPFDSTTQNLQFSLGISYGYQNSTYDTNQQSQVDVNGARMTTAAGGQDDCVTKYDPIPDFDDCGNGELITAGGIGDSPNNPEDPLATSFPCPLGQTGSPTPGARCDDELYSLNPFMHNGDTAVTVNTLNPSNDDNIFVAVLLAQGTAAVVGEGITLGPTSATNPVGQTHTLTAHAQNSTGQPIVGATVTFTDQSGPNAGLTKTAVTDSTGSASVSYTSTTTGTDTWVASFTDASGTHTSNQATKTWTASGPPPDTTPPTCTLTGVIAGPPKQIQITVQDTGSGLGSVAVSESTNASTAVPPFTVGTTSPVVVTATKVNQSQGSTVGLTVTDVAGNVTMCDPALIGLQHHKARAQRFRVRHLSRAESNITMVNGRPGIHRILIAVDGKIVKSVLLRGGQTRTVSVAGAMRFARGNTIAMTLMGKAGGTATVAIHD